MKGDTKKGLTRDQATELYKDLQRTLHQTVADKENANRHGRKENRPPSSISSSNTRLATELKKLSLPRGFNFNLNGQKAAFIFLAFFAVGKIGLSAIEYTGFAKVDVAEATVMSKHDSVRLASLSAPGEFSKEEIEILTQLDKRRAELELRSEKVSDREREIGKKEMELVARLTELKSLTDELKMKREQNDRKKSGQLDQLSKVYTSMAPEESAKLMEQLDITISLSLLQRMPEKRIAQILALMNPERALTLTKMLSQ